MYYCCLKIYCHSNYFSLHCDSPRLLIIIGCLDHIDEVGDFLIRTERVSNLGELLEYCTELSSIVLIIESQFLLKTRGPLDFTFNVQYFLFIID